MKFIVDNNLSWRLTRLFNRLGHEACHVSEFLLAEAPDQAIWLKALEIDAIILTRDADYLDLVMQSESGPAVIWLRIDNMRTHDVAKIIEDILPQAVARIQSGMRLIEYP
jgi:predicted nuclease of predicted toxin-antitoxin system